MSTPTKSLSKKQSLFEKHLSEKATEQQPPSEQQVSVPQQPPLEQNDVPSTAATTTTTTTEDTNVAGEKRKREESEADAEQQQQQEQPPAKKTAAETEGSTTPVAKAVSVGKKYIPYHLLTYEVLQKILKFANIGNYKGTNSGEVVWINVDVAVFNQLFPNEHVMLNLNRLAIKTPVGVIPYGIGLDENKTKWKIRQNASGLKKEEHTVEMKKFKEWAVNVLDKFLIDKIFENQVTWLHRDPKKLKTRETIEDDYYKDGKSGTYRHSRSKEVVAKNGKTYAKELGDAFIFNITTVKSNTAESTPAVKKFGGPKPTLDLNVPLDISVHEFDGKKLTENVNVSNYKVSEHQVEGQSQPLYRPTYGSLVAEFGSLWFVNGSYGPTWECKQLIAYTDPQYAIDKLGSQSKVNNSQARVDVNDMQA